MDVLELNKIVQEHQLWLKSGGKEGKKAELRWAKLSFGPPLTGANLQRSNFNDVNFEGSDLTGTDFKGAEFRRTNFNTALLRQTNLRDADLQNANLENTNFLLTSQLGGADVAGAKLPEPIAEFKGLETIAEATSNAQKLFVGMLGGCIYSWLTIGITKDSALLTNTASSPLPIIGTAIPIVGFYLIAPVVLIALYFYFHLNMQRLWEALSDLPAVFPDGRPLDKMADPWLINGLVRAHFFRLKNQRPALSYMQQGLSIVLAWLLVPLTLFIFWGRFLRRHDWLGSGLHITLVAISIGFGWMSYRLACETIRGLPHVRFRWANAWKDPKLYKRVAGFGAVVLVGASLYFCTHEAIDTFTDDFDYSKPNEKLVPYILRHVGFRTFADIQQDDVSAKMPSWSPVYSGRIEEIASVKGARLRSADMKSAYGFQAFLVNADLNGADLRNAMLIEGNLTHADLRDANLSLAALMDAKVVQGNVQKADLTKANLQGTDLSQCDFTESLLIDADLDRAILKEANLTHADLVRAKLTNTDLTKVNLTRAEVTDADFENADLTEANLKGVDLSYAKGLKKGQIQKAITDTKTLLPENLPP